MKKLRYLFMLIGAIVLSSCIDDTAPEDAFGEGPNLASFTNNSVNLSVIANGDEYVRDIPMKVKGPSFMNISTPVTATISVDPSSTAVEGEHFRLDQTTIQISPDNNYLAELPITVLTEGVQAPLDAAPVLVLNVSAVSGAENVLPDGKKLTINLLYLCDSQLQGSYIVTITRDDGNVYVYPDEIARTGDGQYRGQSAGHYAPGSIGGTPGFDFIDVCNEITVPEQNLVDLYSNLLYGIGDSYVDPNTGTIHIEYEITFAAGNRQYVAEYVKL